MEKKKFKIKTKIGEDGEDGEDQERLGRQHVSIDHRFPPADNGRMKRAGKDKEGDKFIRPWRVEKNSNCGRSW